MTKDTHDPQHLIEAALDDALASRLPRHRPTADFTRRLRARLIEAPARSAPASNPWRTPWRWVLAPFGSALAAAAIVVVVARPAPVPAPEWSLADEAVSDHLRVVASPRPPEIESGGIHQVKPWFTGRVDFAPRVAFAGDDEFPLIGGSLGYVRDHKAAVFQFRHRLHSITLLVFPATGLPWPTADVAFAHLGHLSVAEASSRGFSVLLWRDGELGYALVSDVNRADLEALAQKINP
jgi:anti-sigma factor RsiW